MEYGGKEKKKVSLFLLDDVRYKLRKFYSFLLWVPLIIFLVFCLYNATQAPVHDFANYYFGSYFTLKGEFDKSLYEPLILNQKIVASGYESSWISYSPNPPFTTILFLPFTAFNIEDAKLLFNILSAILFLFSLRRLAQTLKVPEWNIAFIPLILLLPIYNNISFGQVYFILFFLMVEGYLAMKEDKWMLCSLLWAIAILFKITPGVLFFFLLFKRRYKGLIMLSLACVTLFCISLTINGTDVWRFYISTILPKANQGEVTAAAFTINYQSAHMFFKFLFVPDTVDNPNPFFENVGLFIVVMLVFKIVIITLAALYTVKEKSLFSSWAIWILISFLLSPYGSTYAYILLLLPLLIFYEKKKKTFAIYALLSVVILNLQVMHLYDAPWILQFPRLYLLVGMFVLLIIWNRPSWNWKVSVLLACLFISIETLGFRNQTDKSTYLFNDKSSPLACDYNVEDGYFCYIFWSGKELRKQKTELQVVSLDFHGLQILDNQIFYKGQQITSTPDKKLKASIINKNSIIYLSDKGRGYGFYVFRKIPLDSD